MDVDDLPSAKEALRKRELCPMRHISSWSRDSEAPDNICGLPEWASAHGVGAAIWTGLPPKGGGEARRAPVEEVVAYLRGLRGAVRDNAERYIRRAPRQIDTLYRRQIEAELGWTYEG